MRALAIIIMAYVIMVALFTKFVPLPFVGSVAGLLVYPFARMVSWKELFEIYLFHLIFVYVLNFDSLISSFYMISSLGVNQLSGITWLWFILIAFLVELPGAALLSTAIMKIIGVRFKPKILKRLMM